MQTSPVRTFAFAPHWRRNFAFCPSSVARIWLRSTTPAHQNIHVPATADFHQNCACQTEKELFSGFFCKIIGLLVIILLEGCTNLLKKSLKIETGVKDNEIIYIFTPSSSMPHKLWLPSFQCIVGTVPPVSRQWSCSSGESNLRALISGDVLAGIRLRPVDSIHLARKKDSRICAVKLSCREFIKTISNILKILLQSSHLH